MSFKEQRSWKRKTHCRGNFATVLEPDSDQDISGKRFMSSVATVLLSVQHDQSDMSLAPGGTGNQLLLSVTQELRWIIYVSLKKKNTVGNISGSVCKVYGSELQSGLTSVRDLHCSRRSCGSGESDVNRTAVEDCEIAVCQGKTRGQLWAPIAEWVGRDSWKEAMSKVWATHSEANSCLFN